MVTELGRLRQRLFKIGIHIQLVGNFPWLYLDRVNGNKVAEKFEANHGFTIAFVGNYGEANLTNIKEIFKIIRKYR